MALIWSEVAQQSSNYYKLNNVKPMWWIVAVCSSILSIFAGFIIIYTYSVIPTIQNSTRKLLVYLTLADIASAYGHLVGAVRTAFYYYNDYKSRNDDLCVAQSFVTTMSSLCSFSWTSLIALHLFLLVMCNDTDIFQTSKNIKLLFHFLGWCLPGIITTITLGMGKLGEDNSTLSGGWCKISGIDKNDKALWTTVFAGKGWEIFTYVFTTTLYILLKVFTLRKRKREPDFNWSRITRHLRKEDENFCFTFVILYIARLWGTIRFFLFVFDVNGENNTVDTILIYLHSYGDSAQAFWNCILYCLCDKTVRCFVFPCCTTHEHSGRNGTIKTSGNRKKNSCKERASSLTMFCSTENSALIGKIRTTV